MIGMVGRKVGMTRLFDEEGASIPVTVVEVEPNRVTQVKTLEQDGYAAVQVTTGKKRQSRVSKALKGHYAKAKVEAGRGLWEFRVKEGSNYEAGSDIKVDLFNAGDMVDVTGVTKGKGFAGVIKKYHFATQDATHGNSLSHRAPGSIGQRQSPGRVFKGKKMCGHMGSEQKTIQNLRVVRVDAERNCILIRGALPGAPGTYVVINPAVKTKKVA